MKDALGNLIVLGKKYGYVQTHKIATDIVIGTVKKFNDNDNSVIVEPISKKRSVYYDEPTNLEGPHRSSAVKPFILFPITN